jgi:WD40 repeat protein
MNNKNGQFDHVIYNMKNGGYIYVGHTSDGAGVEDSIIVCKCNANNDWVKHKFIPCGGAAVSGSYFAHVTQLKDSTIVVAATLGTNAYYEIINPDDLTKIRSFTTTSKSVFDIAATPDGKFVALENSNQIYSLVQYSSTGTPTALRTFSGTGNTTGALCVTSDQGICVALFLDFLPYVIKMNADGSIDK